MKYNILEPLITEKTLQNWEAIFVFFPVNTNFKKQQGFWKLWFRGNICIGNIFLNPRDQSN